jgi:hypothetical protein
MVVDQGTSITPLAELSTSIGAREVTIHELGHVLGALHEDGLMSVMCTAAVSCGKVGRRSAGGGVGLPDIRSETMLPDDVDFGIHYHASTSTGSIDAVTSPWRFSSGPGLNQNTTRTLCPGQTTTVKFSFGNLGKVNITSASPVNLRVVMSSDTNINTGDTTVTSGTFFADRGFFGTSTWTITVPSVTKGVTYNVGIIADPTEIRSEQDEFNNSSQTGLKITVPSGC